MPNCTSIDPLVTPYVDGEIGPANRQLVDEHLRVCPPCHSRVAAEQAVRRLIYARKEALSGACASPALRARCAAARAVRGAGWVRPLLTSTWRTRLAPLALAASLVLVVAGAFLYQLTNQSSRVLAAELTADHLKCFRVVNGLQEASVVEQSMAASFGWRVQLPADAARAGLQLLGARQCLYGGGRVAHLMYRHNGQPVSVFMLPKKTRPEEVVDVLGHEAVIWASGDRTFVLVSREPREEVARVASYVQAGLR